MEKGRPNDLESAAATVGTELKPTKEPVATYKSIPDDDTNWQANKKNNEEQNAATMGKLNEDAAVNDGADEKMLNEESKIVPAKAPTEVKFISENGDAKIDIETVKSTLSGMGKEELMKYANDPFWIRLRWFLFVVFWLVWIGMLAGAIAIIVMAPKCSSPEPKKWWEESPIVQLEPQDVEGRDAKSLGSLLDTLQGQHVKVLSLSNFLAVNGHTSDFRDDKPQVGSVANVDAIVKAAKERNQHVVLELDPNHSSDEHPWFKSSIKREEPYTNYYVWADKKVGSTDDAPIPPNNWLSIYGGSAWNWNPDRGQFYLHQFKSTQPDLNFNNSAVIAEFGNILGHWLDRGVSGFRLGTTGYLTENPDLPNESSGSKAAYPDQYQSLNHVHTFERDENGRILAQWREIVANRTNGEGLFALRDNIGSDILAVYNDKKTVIDLPQRSLFLQIATSDITADSLAKGVNESIKVSGDWPGWDINGNEASLRSRMPNDIADSITLMTLLLPGTPILRINDTLSDKEAFATVAKARSAQTILYGATDNYVINGTVFVYTRVKSGNPVYLVAYQSGDESAYIDISSLKSVPADVSIYAHSRNYVQAGGTIQKKLPSDQVPISPKSTLVVTFAPKE